MDYIDWTTPSSNDPIDDYTDDVDLQRKIRYVYTLLESFVSIAHVLLWVAILLASSVFFYSIYKFKRLQTRTNYILLQYFISTLLTSLCCTLLLVLNMLPIFHRLTYAFVMATGLSFLGASFIFAFLLAQDWILSVSNTPVAQKYQTYYKWMIKFVYVFIALEVALDNLLPIRITPFQIVFCVTLYGVLGMVIIVFNFIGFRKHISNESRQILYALKVASVYYLMLLPIFMCIFNIFLGLDFLIRSYPILDAALACIATIMELIAFCSPIVIICLLPKWDGDFKIAYDFIFKKSIDDELNRKSLDKV